MALAEVVVYKGVEFRRYPESPVWSNRAYYTPGKFDRDHGFQRLHQEVYKDHHGAIPPGHHVHHVDRDPDNNDPSNLVALSRVEHARVTMEAKPRFESTCGVCGAAFGARNHTYSKYCSRACRAEARRRSGLDDETRICVICGSSFVVNRYKRTRACSRACTNTLISRMKKR